MAQVQGILACAAQAEEALRVLELGFDQVGRDAVSGDIEEAGPRSGAEQCVGDALALSQPRRERTAEIDQWNRRTHWRWACVIVGDRACSCAATACVSHDRGLPRSLRGLWQERGLDRIAGQRNDVMDVELQRTLRRDEVLLEIAPEISGIVGVN